MKVLAIRGKNLASLEGEFALELAEEPLASAGLFVIAGPTGSGKSTLLDALCLALFDAVPRLLDGGNAKIGSEEEEKQRLSASDPRHILRRGSSEGFAEVDFMNAQNQTFRARWSVRRARNKATGKVQQQEMSLHRLPDMAPISSARKTETLHEIQQRLGLSFEQFRRSVLLAQGDFAAFLKAKDAQRAELLERMTGTAIYSLLSKRAFEKAKLQREILGQLQTRLGEHQPLSPAEREQLQQQLQAQLAQQQRLQSQQSALAEQIQWYADFHAQQQRLQQAKAAFDACEQQVQGAKPRRDQLQTFQAVARLMAFFDAKNKAHQEQQQLAASVAQLHNACLQAKTQFEQTQCAALQAEQQWQGLQTEFAGFADEIKQAHTLDAQLLTQRDSLAQVQQTLARSQEECDNSAQQQRALNQQQSDLTQAQALISQQLHDLAVWQDLAAQWPSLHPRLQQSLIERSELQDNQQQLAALSEQQAQLAGQIQQQQQVLNAQQAVLSQQQSEVATAESRLAAFDPQALKAQFATAQTLTQQLQVWLKAEADVQRLQSRADQVQAQMTDLQRQIELQQTELPGLTAALSQALGEKNAATKAYDLSLQTLNADLERLRANLQDEQACPLCGATEHPYCQQNTPLRELADAQQKLRDEAEHAWQHANACLESSQQQLQHKQHSLHEKQAILQQITTDQARLLQEQQDLAIDWDLQPAEISVAQYLQQTQQLEAELHAQQTEYEHKRQALDSAQRQEKSVAAQCQQLRETLQQQQQQAHQIALKLSQKQAQLANLQQQQQRFTEELTRLLPPEFSLSHLAPAQWQERIAKPIQQLHDAKAQQEQIVIAQQNLQLEMSQAEQTLSHHQQQQAEQQRNHQALQTRLQQLSTQRQACLQGAAVNEFEQRWQASLQAAQTAFETSQQQREKSQQSMIRLETERQSKQAQLSEAAAEKAEAEAQFQESIQENDLQEGLFHELVAKAPDWLSQEQAFFTRMDSELHTATVQKAEHERLLAELGQAPEIEEAILKQQQAELAKQLQQSQETLADSRAREQHDQHIREKNQQLLAEIEQFQQKNAVWEQLNELIGSQNGDKFRRFAQSLTLEQVIAFANAHLQQLRPRYRLQRVPSSDLALQVIDTDMADEVRSVNSLSGGESFLVSLSLALGLSSLSSGNVRVASLFIDEGFGSLDPDTLEIALSALDELQAQGRQIALVSHMPSVLERIGAQVRVEPKGEARSVLQVIK